MTRRNDETVDPGDMVEHAILSAVIDLGEASTDDAHRLYSLPDDVHPGVWGGRVGGLVARRIIRSVNRTHTRRPCAHGREIHVYEAVNRDAAIRERDRLAASAARRRPTQLLLLPDEKNGPTSDAKPKC